MKKITKVVALISTLAVLACVVEVNQVYADEFTVSVEQLNAIGIDSEISECTTKYNPREDRAKNIETAAGYLNGLIIPPGQLFSYDFSIHPRTVENGYGPGNAIVNGGHVKVTGGGICQVSSTLNTAALHAGILPYERHNHSTRVMYLPSGLDATVSAGTLDYKFINPYSYPIYIQAIAQNGQLKVALFSNHMATNGIIYKPEVVGGNKKNTTYVVGYFNGIEFSRTKAYSSSYK